MGKAYARYFTHADRDAGSGGFARQVQLWLKSGMNHYTNVRWRTHLEPAGRASSLVVAAVPALRHLSSGLMRELPMRLPRPGARLLDVGCGDGLFLDVARTAGWTVVGVDFDGKAVARAQSRGLDVRLGGLDQLRDLVASFDYVTSSHFIEHVHDPLRWIREICAMVRPQGRLWLQTPNIGSVGHSRYGADWLGLDPPRHLVLLSQDTLCRAIEALGFRTRLLPLAMAFALPFYAGSIALKFGRDARHETALDVVLHATSVFDALRQSLWIRKAEFTTLVASRSD